MAEKTGIKWTDSTFNPWCGCAKVSAGCDNCYAEALDHRTGGAHWGPKAQPRLMSESNWQAPLRWQRSAERAGKRHKVFCGSMCDWCDKNAPAGQLERLWALIRQTPDLDWQLLTKRATLLRDCLPPGFSSHTYPNVWLGVTVENKAQGLPRVEILRQIPAAVRFLSIEPLLEDLGTIDLTGIDWVICGGESGPGARPMQPAWVRSIRDQCLRQRVMFFFKQWGAWTPDADLITGDQLHLTNGKGGSILDNQQWLEFPQPGLRS